MSLNKVLEAARGELGYTESPPGSNRTKYGEAFGWDGVPWCVIFLWWCFREAGEGMAFFGGGKTASCGTLLRWYKAQGQTAPVEDVQPGDIVILNFSGTEDTQHCGLVHVVSNEINVLTDSPDYPLISEKKVSLLKTFEGNTAGSAFGSQDNGGCVAYRTRYPAQIVGVCRPRYKEEPMPTKTDYEGRWSEQDMRWADEAGLIKGYEDGTFRPTQPMTREEVIALLHRYDAAKELGKL
jgi:hypothetical protein